MERDIFIEIRNSVIDLQNSQIRTYERPLRNLSRLLNDDALKRYNSKSPSGRLLNPMNPL